ncbi:MAG: hypothetical protein AAGJ35_08400, partial [Myxococcota bacterium]
MESQQLPAFEYGLRSLHNFLKRNAIQLRDMDLAQFTQWLRTQIERQKQHDSIYAQQWALRARKQELRDKYLPLREAYMQQEKLFSSSSIAQVLEKLRHQIDGSQHAQEGIHQALVTMPLEKQDTLQEKKLFFVHKQQILTEVVEMIRNTVPEVGRTEQAREAFFSFCDQHGIAQAEAAIKAAQQDSGQKRSKSGSSFEDQVYPLVQGVIVPHLLRKPQCSTLPNNVHILSGVKLGSARAEIDYMVVRQAAPQKPVKVLAVVEVKRDPNDIGHGFHQRQETLAWFRGDTQHYDPQEWRTKVYNTGHFDQPATHREHDQTYLFQPESFGFFERDVASQWYLKRLYFIAQKRRLQGLAASEKALLLQRVVNQMDFSIDIQDDVAELQ